jgi:glycosyltransferase involved in cell wall biosynthesis
VAVKRVLFVLHNHPAVQPGGTEAYTLSLYEALREAPGWEPLLLARVAPEAAAGLGLREGQRVGTVAGDPHQMLVQVAEEEYDKFLMTARDKRIYTERFAQVLRGWQPDVIHVQHTLYVGTELIGLARRLLPRAPILHTLHEYLPICNHYGQLVRTFSGKLCLEASPRRCHQCYPEIPPQAFFLRRELIHSQYAAVDMFIAPSRFLLERYADWGIPRDRIVLEDHGFPAAERIDLPDRDPRNRFAFFGVLTPFKGIDVLLRAMEQLGPGFDGHLWVHGTNYTEQPEAVQRELERLFAATAATVTWGGPYDHDRDLPRLMSEIDWVVVPSVWWENSPLVIREAFQHGRPVICSDVGGMAEKVRHEVDGLHFRVGDPAVLAQTIERAAMTPRLWYRLRDGIAPVKTIEQHVATLTRLYDELIERRAAGPAGAASAPLAARW